MAINLINFTWLQEHYTIWLCSQLSFSGSTIFGPV